MLKTLRRKNPNRVTYHVSNMSLVAQFVDLCNICRYTIGIIHESITFNYPLKVNPCPDCPVPVYGSTLDCPTLSLPKKHNIEHLS